VRGRVDDECVCVCVWGPTRARAARRSDGRARRTTAKRTSARRFWYAASRSARYAAISFSASALACRRRSVLPVVSGLVRARGVSDRGSGEVPMRSLFLARACGRTERASRHVMHAGTLPAPRARRASRARPRATLAAVPAGATSAEPWFAQVSSQWRPAALHQTNAPLRASATILPASVSAASSFWMPSLLGATCIVAARSSFAFEQEQGESEQVCVVRARARASPFVRASRGLKSSR